MLVLSRKAGESIVLPHCQAIITVIGVQGNRIRLGVSASDDVSVYRAEVWARILDEQLEASTTVLPGSENKPQPRCHRVGFAAKDVKTDQGAAREKKPR